MSMSARRLAMAGLSTIGKWWERYDPVIAYQAFGANSLEESYINLANPGVYDAVPGPVPPSWTRETGWDFPNFTTSYLNTGWTPPDTNVTAIVRYSDMIAPGGKRSVLFGALDGTKYFWIQPSFSGLISWANGGGFAPAGTLLSGVIGFAGSSAYYNGVRYGTIASGPQVTIPVYIGQGNPTYNTAEVKIQGIAFYENVLLEWEYFSVESHLGSLVY